MVFSCSISNTIEVQAQGALIVEFLWTENLKLTAPETLGICSKMEEWDLVGRNYSANHPPKRKLAILVSECRGIGTAKRKIQLEILVQSIQIKINQFLQKP